MWIIVKVLSKKSGVYKQLQPIGKFIKNNILSII